MNEQDLTRAVQHLVETGEANVLAQTMGAAFASAMVGRPSRALVALVVLHTRLMNYPEAKAHALVNSSIEIADAFIKALEAPASTDPTQDGALQGE